MSQKTTISIIIAILALALIGGVDFGCKQKQEKTETTKQSSVTIEKPTSKTTTQTTTSKPSGSGHIKEIKTGQININDAEIADLQKGVDSGHQPWRLDPLMTAKAEASKYGFSVDDTFTLKETMGSVGVAKVEAVHNEKIYFITLIQPIPGEGKIWIIQKIEY